MFDELYSSYRNIISNIAIIGYSENDIKKRGNNISQKLELTCLYCYPEFDENAYTTLTYDMMLPNGNHKIECPKYFSLTLTNEKGTRYFLYCLQFPEIYRLEIDNNKNNDIIEINVPIIICIKSEKNDLESFRQLLVSINQIIVSESFDYDSNTLNNYKKVELMNIFYFIFSLPHTAPHSLVRLKLNNDLCELEEEIDFYFSSNCEIPCNKNDTDINFLFLFLDQSIIIKVIIAILSEKTIVFVSSKAYVLHLIVSTFLKLIFPFKWIGALLMVLSKDTIESFLDYPSASIVGVLSNVIGVKEILNNYPGKIVVDCDTNELLGDNLYDPFIASKDKVDEDNLGGKKKNKDKNKDKKISNNSAGGIKQGKNIFIVDGSFIYEYDPENKGKGKKLKFTEKGNIIIDTQKSELLFNKSSEYISSDELKWLRKNIQLVRNPEIFDIENIENKKDNLYKKKDFNDNESIILPNRSFSYNIQNILTHFYLKKISDENCEFMKMFKNTNIYANYTDNKKYQNDSGGKIIENIKETINDQRSIDNCFIVEYNNKIFCALSIIEELDKKMAIKQKKGKNEIYNKLKNILFDYCVITGINVEQVKNETFNQEENKCQRLSRTHLSKTKIKHFKNKGHIKSNKSLLQFTFNQNPNFNLTGIENSSTNIFKFYGKNGFLHFLNDIEDFIKEERKDLEGIIYKDKIYNQLINIYKNYDTVFLDPNEEKNVTKNVDIDILEKEIDERSTTINIINNPEKDYPNDDLFEIIDEEEKNDNILEEIRNGYTIRKTNKSIAMSMIEEKDEENNESFFEKNISKKSTFKNNMLLNNMIFKNEENNDENYNSIDIIVFPNFSKNTEGKDFFNYFNQLQFDNNINDINKKNNKCQYFLFLAYYLEEIVSDNLFLEKFNKDLFDSIGIHININKYILKLYKEAYIQSGEKHRDFPYFTFYSFLNSLDYEALSNMENNLKDINGNYSELYEIFLHIYSKNIPEEKLSINNYDSRNTGMKDRGLTIGNTGNILNPMETLSYIGNKSYRPDSYNINMPKNSLFTQKNFNYSPSIIDDKNCSKIYIINDSPLFKPKCKPRSTHVINEFCILFTNLLPTEKDIKTKNIQQIFDQLYVKVNLQSIRELLGQLTLIELNTLNTPKEKLCFWLNCFNYLLLYAIFYLKLNNLSEKDIWRNFFRNIKYIIGSYYFSFEDMLYIIFKKNIFFPNDEYIPPDYVQENAIDFSKDKVKDKDKDKDNINDIAITPFLLYLPTGHFIGPIIYNESNLENEIKERIKKFLSHFIKWNENSEIINVNGLILISEPSFVKKYKKFIEENIYNILKLKKYKRMSIMKMKWDLCFDYLFENIS